MNTEPSYHPDANALSFNVKTLGLRWPEGGTDAQREAAWEAALQDWWRDAKLLAAKHGFTDVHAYGRSSGWLTPVPEVRVDDCSADDLARIRAFGKELDKLFNEAPTYFGSALTDVLDIETSREEAERAERDRKLAYGEAVTLLANLAIAVKACDTTSGALRAQAAAALDAFNRSKP